MSLYNAVYGAAGAKADYAKAKPADRAALAAKLLEQAEASKEDAAAKYVLLLEARDAAAKGGDAVVFLKAADELAAAFRMAPALAQRHQRGRHRDPGHEPCRRRQRA